MAEVGQITTIEDAETMAAVDEDGILIETQVADGQVEDMAEAEVTMST